MKGIQHIEISNRFAKYKFDLFRNITVVKGESATGKTTLYNMVADYTRDREKSGVNIFSSAQCFALTDLDWKHQLSSIHDCIVFIDEDSKYITSVEFAETIKKSGNYYVIFTRENMHNLPYSVNEIYEIKTSGKHHSFIKLYSLTEQYELKVRKTIDRFMPEVILTEDSNSGFQFFENVANEKGIQCESLMGNSSLLEWLKQNSLKKVMILCDGASFGSEIERVAMFIQNSDNYRLILPESFEWIILKSGIIRNIDDVLDYPYDYIECSDYFSWENFFTAFLIEKTNRSYLQYEKKKLNSCYLKEPEKQKILSVLPDIKKNR